MIKALLLMAVLSLFYAPSGGVIQIYVKTTDTYTSNLTNLTVSMVGR